MVQYGVTKEKVNFNIKFVLFDGDKNGKLYISLKYIFH